MKINQRGLDLIKYYEGCVLKAYPDPKTGGVPWTVGYGHTGVDVHPGLVIDQHTADAMLVRDLERFERGILAAVDVKLNENQFSALVSFVYNVGLGRFIHSTLLKELNDGDFEGAMDQLLLFINKGSPVEAGLRKRRAAEKTLFLSKD